jgi:hypothetical protein
LNTKPGREDVGTVEELQNAARSLTGLDDFGEDDYSEGLDVLLDSYAREAALTPWGNRVNHAILRGALVARLLSEAAWRGYPQHANVRIERPIFVTGLPRTGTTALHRLLCADPAHQGLEVWLTAAPQPRPPRDTWAANPVFQRVEERYRHHELEDPEFMGLHYMSADTVEECWQLLQQSMTSISFESLALVPSYSQWLARQDWTPAYRRHRRNLQMIGLNDPDRRWVLKNPGHLFALPELMAVYPDALIVQTHRDPRNVIASVSSLTARATAGQSERFHGEAVGRAQLDLWARGAELFMAQRERYDAGQFVDVQYRDFVADPMRTVEMIYERAEAELTPAARAAIVAVQAESTEGGRRPAHRYELSDFGLSAEQVDERFARYRGRHLG